jgi:HlyD family secretion protein
MVAGALAALTMAGSAVFWAGKYYSGARYGPPAPDRAAAHITAAAVVSAAATIPVEAKSEGVIEAVYCEAGAIVKAGELCAKIGARPYQLIVDSSTAALAAANRRLEKSKARLTEAQAAYKRSHAVKPAPQRQNALDAAQKALEHRQAQAAGEQDSVILAREALRLAEIGLEGTNVRSPADGIVISRTAVIGKEAGIRGSEPLFIIAETATVQITLRVAQWVAQGLRPGKKNSLSAGVLPGHLFQGEITQIARRPRAADGTENYDVVILAANPDGLLKPGMSIEMTLDELQVFQKEKTVTSAPRSLIVPWNQNAAQPTRQRQ